MPATGQCLCGAIHYRLSGEPFSVSDCHCSVCRRESGAASLLNAGYRRADVTLRGVPKYFRSSALARRGFCAACGSPLCYEADAEPESIWLTVGTHDDAGSLAPRDHLWVEDKLPWVTIPEGVRQWPQDRGR